MNRTDIIIELLNLGLRYQEIANKTGVSRQRVGQVAKQYVPSRYMGEALYAVMKTARSGNKKLKAKIERKQAKAARRKEKADMLRQLIEVQGLSFCRVAVMLGTNVSTLIYFCRQEGIKSRHISGNPNCR